MHHRPLQVWQETRMWQPRPWLNANQGTVYPTVLRNISPLFCYNIVHSSDSVCLVNVCQDLLEKMWEFLGRVITGDETWVFQYDPETKRQSLQLKTQNSPRAKKAHMSKSKIKVMLIAFFDQRGVVHEFGPQGQTVNQQFYQWLLNSPNDWVRRSRWALWRDKSWLLHHDIPTHTPFTVRQFSANKQITALDHPPYIAPYDFWVFPRMKTVLKGTHFPSAEQIKATVTRELRGLKEDFVIEPL